MKIKIKHKDKLIDATLDIVAWCKIADVKPYKEEIE